MRCRSSGVRRRKDVASGVVQSSALPGMRLPSRAVRAGGKGLCVGEGRYVCVGGPRREPTRGGASGGCHRDTGEQNVACARGGAPLSVKAGRIPHMCLRVGDLGGHCAPWHKPVTTGRMPCDSTCTVSRGVEFLETESRGWRQGPERGNGASCRRHRGSVCRRAVFWKWPRSRLMWRESGWQVF